MLFRSSPRTVEIDGREVPVASLIKRGGAFAVDLCAGMFIAIAAMWIVSQRMPLDLPEARRAVLGIVLIVAVYLLWARDHGLPSPGRRLFSLRLVYPARGGGLLARPLTIEAPGTVRLAGGAAAPRGELVRVWTALGLVAGTSLAGLLIFAHALTTTTVYRSVQAFVDATSPFASRYGAEPDLANLPRVVLIGDERAYVQVDAEWGARQETLEFFLEREGRGWRVRLVRPVSSPRLYGNFALKVQDSAIPAAPR